MENIFDKILGNNKIQATKIVLKSFSKNFPDARNIEWNLSETIYEAVFYEADIEKIVRIDSCGTVIDTKINLPFSSLPAIIKEAMNNTGEVMNVISIQSENELIYEFIVRDKTFQRFQLLVNENGKIQEKKLL